MSFFSRKNLKKLSSSNLPPSDGLASQQQSQLVYPCSAHNDLYVFSTRDFSTTLLHTSGDSPKPRAGHGVALTSTVLVIWGGITSFVSQNASNRVLDDSFYLLNLGTSDLLVSRLTPVDQRLRSSITRVDPCLGQRSRARRSLLPYNDVGRFQALRLWRRGHQ